MPKNAYRTDILNWNVIEDLPNAKISFPKLCDLIESHPYGFLDWPRLAGQLGFRVRAYWVPGKSVGKEYLCEAEFYLPFRKDGSISILYQIGRTYFLTYEGKWVERHKFLFGTQAFPSFRS